MGKIGKIKKVIFMGRKRGAAKAVKFLLEKGIGVALIVGPEEENYTPSLRSVAKENKISFFSDDKDVYDLLKEKDGDAPKDIDLVISYLYWRKIKEPLIRLSKKGCINFHPAPLPDYKSRAGYNTAILENRETYGVTAHFIDSEDLDSGPIIKRLDFPIDQKNENVLGLYIKAQRALLDLFKETIEIFLTKEKIPVKKNEGGLYLSGKQLEDLKKVNLDTDSPADINKKIRAFFFPPHSGAYIEVGGEKVTLINHGLLDYLSRLLNL